MAQEFGLAADNRLAHFHNGLLPLLDVLHELDSRHVPLAHVVANFLGSAIVAFQHLAVLRIEPKLRHILIVHLDDVIVAILSKVDVGLHHARACAGIAQTRPRIQVLNHVHRNLHVLYGPP